MSLNRAIALAKTNTVKGLPRMAALLTTKAGTFEVAWGLNSRKTHPLMKKFGKHEEALCIHAEIACIADALRQRINKLDDLIMYVARVNAKGEPMMAKPCLGCQRALIEFNIGDVRWTT